MIPQVHRWSLISAPCRQAVHLTVWVWKKSWKVVFLFPWPSDWKKILYHIKYIFSNNLKKHINTTKIIWQLDFLARTMLLAKRSSSMQTSFFPFSSTSYKKFPGSPFVVLGRNKWEVYLRELFLFKAIWSTLFCTVEPTYWCFTNKYSKDTKMCSIELSARAWAENYVI